MDRCSHCGKRLPEGWEHHECPTCADEVLTFNLKALADGTFTVNPR